MSTCECECECEYDSGCESVRVCVSVRTCLCGERKEAKFQAKLFIKVPGLSVHDRRVLRTNTDENNNHESQRTKNHSKQNIAEEGVPGCVRVCFFQSFETPDAGIDADWENHTGVQHDWRVKTSRAKQ